jgi:hydroxymethylbilane synthase
MASGSRDTLRLGTRGSALALAQAELMARALARPASGLEVEIVPITTSGDAANRRSAPLGDKSRFVKELEDSLLRGDVDLAVHSAKDVPGALPDGLAIVGVPERADPRDALCGANSIAELPEGARVGTSSLRRRAQLLALRPDLQVEDLHGNVDTRLGRLARGDFDALVLAAAGLARLGLEEGEPLPVDDLTPAPGQGCLALEARSDDERAAELARLVTDRSALLRLTAERAVVSGLEATCRTPVGAHSELDGDRLVLSSFVGLPDGSTWIRDAVEGDPEDPAALGARAAARLLTAGARDLLDEAERAAA